MKDKFTSFSIEKRFESIVWNFKQGRFETRFSRNPQIQIAQDLVLIVGTNDMGIVYSKVKVPYSMKRRGTGFKNFRYKFVPKIFVYGKFKLSLTVFHFSGSNLDMNKIYEEYIEYENKTSYN